MRVLIVGGGTGGHLFPAIALAEAFQSRDPTAQLHFVVTPRTADARMMRERGYRYQVLEVEGLLGRGLLGRGRALVKLVPAFLRSWRLIQRFQPDLILGVGGYVTGPVILAGRFLKVTCAIQEQNAIPGVTNRLLGRWVDRVYVAFDRAVGYFPRGKSRITGNPIRRELWESPGNGWPEPGRLRVLIVGGSQGAHRINQTMIQALDGLMDYRRELHFLHQTGLEDEAEVARAYREKGFSHEVKAFIEDMGRAYAQAQVVIGRAGAMTVSELAALGKPALLIPYPHAAHNHQEYNARFLMEAGAAEMVLEKDLTPTGLGERIQGWLKDPEALKEMGKKAAGLGRKQAAEEIVEDCFRLLAEKRGKTGGSGPSSQDGGSL